MSFLSVFGCKDEFAVTWQKRKVMENIENRVKILIMFLISLLIIDVGQYSP